MSEHDSANPVPAPESDAVPMETHSSAWGDITEPVDPTQIKRAEPDSPNRCQAAVAMGQCPNEIALGATTCRVHGGAAQQANAAKASLRNYQVGKYQARLERFSSSDVIKSLREEIGILRLLIETMFEKCQDSHDLLLQSGPIADLVMKVEKTVVSCHTLEGKLKQVLDKQALIQFAGEVVGIVGDALPEAPDKIDEISNGILALIGRLGEE